MQWVPPTRGDAAIAAVATAIGVVSVVATGPQPDSGIDREPDALAVLLGVLTTAPIVLRRTAPFGVLALGCICVVLAAVRGNGVAAGALGPAFSAASAAYLTNRRGTIAAGVLFGAAILLATHIAIGGQPGTGAQLTTTAAVAVLVVVVGDGLRTLHDRNRELEALRETEAREAVAQERVRIAREVHDVVGHALAGIALQARAARRLLDRDRDRTAEALRTIDELAGRALSETREAIGLIRDPGQHAELRPAPGLGDLDDLVEGLRGDDLRIRLERDAGTDAAPALVQASAYRIVQEALSNVARHAAPATAVVSVALREGRLELEVRDDGRRRPAGDGAGNGLRGMRERAAECGGEVSAGPAPGGGWSVRATLPATRAAA